MTNPLVGDIPTRCPADNPFTAAHDGAHLENLWECLTSPERITGDGEIPRSRQQVTMRRLTKQFNARDVEISTHKTTHPGHQSDLELVMAAARRAVETETLPEGLDANRLRIDVSLLDSMGLLGRTLQDAAAHLMSVEDASPAEQRHFSPEQHARLVQTVADRDRLWRMAM